MKQPRWQRQLVGAAAMVVGVFLCAPMAMIAWDLWRSWYRTPSIETSDWIVAGFCATLGCGMFGLGLYDGFLSPNTSIGPQHNRWIKTSIWLAIATFGGFIGFSLVMVSLQLLAEFN